MKNVQGSNVFSNVRAEGAATWSAASLLAVVLLSPVLSYAGTIWQSAPSHADVVENLVPDAPERWYGTNPTPSIFLGTWTAGDFTSDASTTLHLWAQWNGVSDPILDISLVASSGGDPFYGTPSTTSAIVAPATSGGLYRLNATATDTPREYSLPLDPGGSIRQGQEIWAWLYPSAGAYGANFLLGASGTVPYLALCEGSCSPDIPPQAPCTSGCNSNVLFIPGIESSRLYDTDNGETHLWEPEGDALAQNLALDEAGKSIRSDIYTRDIVDTAYGVYGMYDSFIQSMNALKASGAINDWAAAPYDWRLSLDQLLSNGAENGGDIFYAAATDTPYIIQTLKQLAATSKTGEVTIVAHSNGGLIAKELTEKLGPDAASYIDKIIFVAVPQIGTPEDIGALLDGYDQGVVIPPQASWIPGAVKITPAETRALGDNSPAAYNLLPSPAYFSSVSNPVLIFSTSTLPDWASKYGASITTENGLTKFLTDTQTRSVPLSGDINSPTILSVNLLSQAQTVHDDLDAWTPPQGVQLIQIAGWGIPSTLSGILYGLGGQDGTTTITETPVFTNNGDGIVVVPSALWTSTTTGTINYWLNLGAVNEAGPLVKVIPTLASVLAKSHGNIFTVSQLDSFISDIITNSQRPLSAYQYISTTSPTADPGIRHLEYSLHSPLSLDMYDNEGRHTGISTTTGMVEEQIPGTYYTEFGGAKYIFADESIPQTINMTGYGGGTFTFSVDELAGDNAVVASTTFADVPTTPQTGASVSIPSTLSSISDLTVDTGSTSVAIVPKLNGTVSPDFTPPTTVATSTGTKGLNGWYISNVLVTLYATDTQSGVASTTYSINSGATWWPYPKAGIPISKQGTTTIQYFSVDSTGNKESTSSLTVKIDKTPPEAQITFSTSTQSLTVIGRDNLSSTTVSTGATSSLIKDAAGHTLLISFSPFIARGIFVTADITKLTYDGVARAVSGLLDYASMRKPNGTYSLFASYIKTKSTALESHYRPKLNMTYIMASPGVITSTTNDDSCELRAVSKKLPGMIIPGMVTNKATLSVYY